jgi:hypothetical protein
MINCETVSALATTAHLKREFACDRHLRNVHIQVERKRLTLDLKENLSGMFLRITEEVATGLRNSIVIPATGLELFRDALNEVIRFGKSLGGVERSSDWRD